MPVKSLSHIGIAVHSIDEQRPFYEKTLGLRFEGIEEVPSQQVRVASFQAGEMSVELLEPTAATSPIAKFLEKRGAGLHHVSYAVDNIAERIAEFEQLGVQMIDREPRPGSCGTQIAFLHPGSSHGVLTEICEQRE